MKTQISRDSFNELKNYSGVYQQQGRMFTDADWNELVEIIKQQLNQAQNNILFRGVPRHQDGKRIIEVVGNNININPNDVYANGIHGKIRGNGINQDEVISFNEQKDLVIPSEYEQLSGNYILYADIFDLPVISLQDPEIRDAGLKGADTCTRTRRLVQIKQCIDSLAPEDETDNPSLGNAEIDLQITNRVADSDDCDPCATSITAKPDIGNYLFRIEVHEVKGPQHAPTEITLKWSSENASEVYEVGSEPLVFKTGNWVYEFFNDAKELQAGVHLSSDSSVLKNSVVLHETYPDNPAVRGVDNTFVRRWDGYVKLNTSVSPWVLDDGKDRSTDLVLGSGLQPGKTVIDSTKIVIQLSQLTLTVYYSGKSFVKGDFWYADLRKDNKEHVPSYLLLNRARPTGIKHHYVTLAKVAGNVLQDLVEGKPEWRKLNFPPLTDMNAREIGYAPTCSSGSREPVFNSEQHFSVKKALDALCELDGRHIGYSADCVPGDRTPLFNSTHDTVKKALDHLCQLDAGHIGFNQGEDCSLLGEGVNTVEDALYKLCKIDRGGSGCRVVKHPDQSLKDILSGHSGQRVMCLCLLPGEHDFNELNQFTSSFDIFHVKGCGTASVINIYDESGWLFDKLSQVVIEDVVIVAKHRKGISFLSCGDVFINRCRIYGDDFIQSPLVQFYGSTIRFIDNIVSVEITKSRLKFFKMMGFEPALKMIFKEGVDPDDISFRGDVKKLANSNFSARKKIQSEFANLMRVGEFSSMVEETGIKENINSFLMVLGETSVNESAVIELIKNMFKQISFGWAIEINHIENKAEIEGNNVNGILSMGANGFEYDIPVWSKIETNRIHAGLEEKSKLITCKGNVSMEKNTFSRIVVGKNITQWFAAINARPGRSPGGRQPESRVKNKVWFPYNFHFANNLVTEDNNVLLSLNHNITGNNFRKSSDKSAFVIGIKTFFQFNHGSSNSVVFDYTRAHLPIPSSNYNFIQFKEAF